MEPSINPTPDINTSNSTVKSYIIKYWFVFVIVLFIISNTVLWSMYNSKSIELSSATSKLNMQKSLDETHAKLDDILNREKDVYPKLLEIKREMSVASTKLADLQASVVLTKKEKIGEEVSKMDLNGMSSYLFSVGYSNAIGCGK